MKHKRGRRAICKICVVMLLITLICFLPDLLLCVRINLKKIPFLNNLICPQINDIKYIDLIVTPLFNSIAIAISVFALQTERNSVRMQKAQQKEKNVTACIKIKVSAK